MSAAWLLLYLAALAACMLVLAITAALFSPVIVTVDSGKHQVRVRWLAMLEFLGPVPGTAGRARLAIAGRPVWAVKEETGGKGTTVQTRVSAPKQTPVHKTARRRRPLGRFFWHCLSDPGIRNVLARRLARLWRQLLRSAAITRFRSTVSLPDPALNGMLAGVLAPYGWGRRLGTTVNFTGENSVLLELRLRPHRVAKAVLFFISSLPYRALVREWRASSAKQREQAQ